VPVAADTGEGRPVERARRALDDGVTWRARDILLEHVEHERDVEALTLLGEVLHDMGDLPRAGAMWFAAGAKGPQVDAAVAAWREQSHDHFDTMWAALPPSVQEEPRAPRVEALREKARASSPDDPDLAAPTADVTPDEGKGTDAAQVIAWILAAAFVVLAVVGAVTVLGWIVPGD
jgi:hypothetical protein